ncbi:hypothetical protein PM082_006156 [Marasmius tenuissimus]|nr:hypothetical protein PM082_006156 [Marasmius tenuissimus]
MYELEDEPRLNPRILMVMDGNNSLKMVDADHKRGQARTDSQQLNDPRWLSSIAVDRFKDEVANSQRATKKKLPVSADITSTPGLSAGDSASGEANASTQHHADGNSVPCDPIPGNSGPTLPNAQSDTPQPSNPAEEIAWLNVLEEDELRACVNACVDHWKATSPDPQKKMFAFFAVTGVFIAVCRHGHLIVMCDMRRSRELMKYPLAITDAILERYGEDIGLGYDIMCAFFKTLQRSGQLGAKVAALRLRGVVPAFHGHPALHVLPPRFIIAKSSWSTSTSSQDKNANFGNWAHQMYHKALSRLKIKEPVFRQKCPELHMDPSDCERLLEEERAFFMRDFTELPEMVRKLDYAELLLKLWTTKALSDEADM